MIDKIPKKTAAKKAAKPARKSKPAKGAKKAEEDAPKKATPRPTGGAPLILSSRIDFNNPESLKEFADYGQGMKAALAAVSEKSQVRPVSYGSASDFQKVIMEVDHFMLQYVIGCKGFRAGTSVGVLGDGKVGKTSFLMQLLGGFAMLGCRCLYMECDSRLPKQDQIHRHLHPNRAAAAFLEDNMMDITRVDQLSEMATHLEQWLVAASKKRDSSPRHRHLPLVFAVDPWNKLLNEAEAQGWHDYGAAKGAPAKKAKETGTASNLGHAKFAAAMTRKLGTLLHKYNAIAFFGLHTAENFSMATGPGGKAAPPVHESNNTRVLGGRSWKQTLAAILTLTKGKALKDSNNRPYGYELKLKMAENSFGAPNRSMMVHLRNDHYVDTAEERQPAIGYAEGTALWMAAEGLLGTSLHRGLYSCSALGLTGATAKVFYSTLQSRPDLISHLGRALNIEGYQDVPVPTEASPSPVLDPTAPPPPPMIEVETLTPEEHGEAAV